MILDERNKDMNAQIVKGLMSDKRLLNADELSVYIGLGRYSARKYAEQVGAVKKFGRRVMFDKTIIDASLNGGGKNEKKI